MLKQNEELSKELALNQVESENLLLEDKYQTNKEFQDASREIVACRSMREYESMIDMEIIKSPKLKREDTQKGDKKLTASQVKKQPKACVINFEEFLPELLMLLNQQKHKSIIRIGKNYQANVPRRCNFSYLYRPMSHLKVWSAGEIQPSIFKKFRQKFGQNRTEEDLCALMFQYQCDWNQISTYFNEFKGELRRSYIQKDRTKL